MVASEAVPDLHVVVSSARPAVPTSIRGVRLNKTAVYIMRHWYEANLDHPYPDTTTTEELAKAGQITIEQVKKWLSNKRMRCGKLGILKKRFRKDTLQTILSHWDNNFVDTLRDCE